MEAIRDDVSEPIGFMRIAPVQAARGPMFGAAQRAASPGLAEPFASEPVVSEKELYDP
jgi:hypothetical protein